MSDEEVAKYLSEAVKGDGGIYLRDRLYKWFGQELVKQKIQEDNDE